MEHSPTNRNTCNTLICQNDDAAVFQTFHEELAILKFTEDVISILNRYGLTYSDLAERLGTSPPFVTKLLSGRNNFTLKTMVKVAAALGCEFKSELIDVRTEDEWRHCGIAQETARATSLPYSALQLNDRDFVHDISLSSYGKIPAEA